MNVLDDHQKTTVRPLEAHLWYLPVYTRVPLKFGPEVTTKVVCARTKVVIQTKDGKIAEGWGETPLSVAWVWPSDISYKERESALKDFCKILAQKIADYADYGHPMDIGHGFVKECLPGILQNFNAARAPEKAMPWLAALVAFSLFDIAIHDAFSTLLGKFVYDIYGADCMSHDLAWYYGDQYKTVFKGKYPADFFVTNVPSSLPAWHLVGGKDLLAPDEKTGSEPDDGYPVLLEDWIQRDGLKCLKIKLTGNDSTWDYDRLVRVGKIAIKTNVDWLSADFNCTVLEPGYVTDILDRLTKEHPRIAGMLLYVEQPFPYDLRSNQIDVRSVSARKPLFMDESAHDWELVALGRSLGWSGVALKTCKTQTGALLSLCWAKAHGMTLMVQDLTNPMLAQIPHVLLAAHAGTIMGVETNSSQFYPEASASEAKVHPGLYRRRNGMVDLSSIGKIGFGYRLSEIARELPVES